MLSSLAFTIALSGAVGGNTDFGPAGTAISRSEFIKAIDARFAAIDTDHDGSLDELEIAAAQQKVIGQSQTRLHVKIAPNKLVEQLDSDHDGRVSEQEYRDATLVNFDKLDTDHDGTVIEQKQASASCKGSVSRGKEAFDSGDYEAAFCHWWPKALRGDLAAQNNIGVLFENGLSAQTPQGDEAAAEWYLKSAKQGFTVAMRNLAREQQRLGYSDAAASWLALAAQTEANHQAEMQAAVSSFGFALGCALAGGCTSGTNSYQPSFGSQSAYAAPSSPKPITMCPDGSYVSGSQCSMAPNGRYVSGTPVMAPDGTFVGGSPRIAPNGTYVGGTGNIIICPDGTYVTGTSCRLTPAGTYVGD